jgi:hypothetical protein
LGEATGLQEQSGCQLHELPLFMHASSRVEPSGHTTASSGFASPQPRGFGHFSVLGSA